MRVFIAIELDEEIKKYIEKKQGHIKNYCINGNFSKADNLHLTLRFIGEVSEEEINKLKKAINQIARWSKPFDLSLGNLGYFPSNNKSILWIGIEKGEKEIKNLFNQLQELLEAEGFPREKRRFKPHITIGREVRFKENFDIISHNVSMEHLVLPVRKISLMNSTRVEGKLSYIPIYAQNFDKQ